MERPSDLVSGAVNPRFSWYSACCFSPDMNSWTEIWCNKSVKQMSEISTVQYLSPFYILLRFCYVICYILLIKSVNHQYFVSLFLNSTRGRQSNAGNVDVNPFGSETLISMIENSSDCKIFLELLAISNDLLLRMKLSQVSSCLLYSITD